MSSLPAESTPLLAGLGLAACLVAVVGLAGLRDPTTIAALEASGPLEAAASGSGASPGDSEARSGAGSPNSSPSSTPSATRPGAVAEIKAEKRESTSPALDRATTIPALKALLAENPDDEQILTKLARLEGAQPNGLADALVTLKTLFALAPELAADKELGGLVVRAADSKVPGQQDAAFALLADGMGSTGPDLLFDLASSPSASKAAKSRALLLTKRDDVRKLATPALRIALDLRDKTACERAPLFAEAQASADRRSLSYLTPLNARKGCGFLGMNDCFSCLGGRGELNKAITAINKR
jgi:hypothetical protein